MRTGNPVRPSLSQALASLSSTSLRVLRCSSGFDAPFIAVLRKQGELQELHWECPSVEGMFFNEVGEKPSLPVDENLSPETVQSLLDTRHRLLPKLHALRTNSYTLALALIPGRPTSHMWVTDFKAFTPTELASTSYSSMTRLSTPWDPRGPPVPQQQILQHESDTTPRETFWSDLFCRLAAVLALQTTCETETRSVRLDFEDLPRVTVADVLRHFARVIGPTIRTLGFLDSAAVEELLTWTDKKGVELFTNLHTITLSYTPSPSTIEQLAKSTALPALRTVACYGFTRSFEYLCVPVNDAGCACTCTCVGDEISGSSTRRMVSKPRGIQYQPASSGWSCRTAGIDWALDSKGRRRATAVHDPDYKLWLDA